MDNEVDIFAPVTDLGKRDALECWRWLVGKKASMCLLTSMGDLFFKRKEGLLNKERVYFLDTGTGEMELAAKSWNAFREMMAAMKDIPGHWFKYRLLLELVEQPLTQGCCYSPIQPPIMGGEYITENYQSISWEVHLDLLGQIHEQLSGLPPGTPITSVSLKIEED
ncbi:T6SS immunity protein Tdi1 domain-containing protein [Microbulbifer sp. SSSA005]|uniref:T6SS immunity protein Tdi1 domain-containing protein n=1 Tax=unclassified Microbulbifer TaxID=2619833 RepID=UPI00403A4432